MKWILGLVVFLFGVVLPAYALEVGALADRVVEGGVSVSLAGKTAPWVELVVVDESAEDLVMAVAEIEESGEFEFFFEIVEDQRESLTAFAIDGVGMTSRVVLEEFLDSNGDLLMPATIVNDVEDLSKTAVALTGFGHGESEIDVHVYGDVEFDEIYESETDANGRWRLKLDSLPAGKYTATAQISNENLTSQLSQEIYFEIGGEGVVAVTGEVIETVAELVNITVARIIEEPEEVSKVAVPVAAMAVALPLLLRDGLALLLRLALTIASLFGWGRKRKSWGMVYDSVTKRPLSRAIVRLFDRSRKLLETDVTGEKGVFSFLPKPGEYFIAVARAGFRFPSELIKGAGSDGEHAHLYHGEVLKVTQDMAVVVSIPVDPVKYKPGFWFYVRRYGGIAWNVGSWVLLAIGLSSASLALWREITVFNVIMFVVEVIVLIWILWEIRRKVVSWSVVRDGQGRSVGGVTLSLYEVEFKRMVQRRVSDEKGRFQMIVPAGKYKLEVSKEGYMVDLGRLGGFGGDLIEVVGKKDKAIRKGVYLKKI